MFRGVSNLKGLIVDYGSFQDIGFDLEVWEKISEKYLLCFILVENDTKSESIRNIEAVYTYDMQEFLYQFAPSEKSHKYVLEKMELFPDEVAYVSSDYDFIERTLKFTSGSILISNPKIAYVKLGRCPDLIVSSASRLVDRDLVNVGYFGELCTRPDFVETNKRVALLIQSSLGTQNFLLFSFGRYFGSTHYMNDLHSFSKTVWYNKSKKSALYGKYNEVFFNIFLQGISELRQKYQIDGIASVPNRPSSKNRFAGIVQQISEELELETIMDSFVCTEDYPTQKGLSFEDRTKNIKGKFRCDADLSNKTLVLVDDVVSTGSTLVECATVLKKAGAQVIILVLAINQFGNYWGNDEPRVICDVCGGKMSLRINSKNLDFFYSCSSCYSQKGRSETIGYLEGRCQWLELERRKFQNKFI